MITRFEFVDFKWESEKACRMTLILLLKEAMRKAKANTYHPPKFPVRFLYGVSHKPVEPPCPLYKPLPLPRPL